MLLMAGLLLPFSSAEAKKKKKDRPDGVREPIAQWLMQAPDSVALPVFHDASSGGIKAAELLGAAGPIGPDAWPAAGMHGWEPQNFVEGAIVLQAPGEEMPARALLAVYLETDRFRKRTIEIKSKHPLRVWLDAEAQEKGETIELTLLNGKHLLRIETVFDPSMEEDWTLDVAWTGKMEEDINGVQESLDPARSATILDVVDAPDISSLSLSPDGKYVATAMRRTRPGTEDRESWIEVRRVSDGTVTGSWRGGFGMSQVAWAPSGRRLTYVTRSGSGEKAVATLWVADLETGGVRPILEEVKRFGSYNWSPEGSFLVFSTSVKAKEIEHSVKRLEGLRDRWSSFRTKNYLNLVDAEGGDPRRLTAGAMSTSLSDIAADGSRLLFTRDRDKYESRPYTTTELWELDLKNFGAKKILENPWINGALYSPNGKTILLVGAAEMFPGGLDVEGELISNSYDTQIFLWDPETDIVDPLSPAFDPSISSVAWSNTDGMIYLTAQERDYARLFRLDPATKTFTRIDTGIDMFGSLRLAADAAVAVGLGTSPWQPETLVAVDLAADRAHTVVRPGEEWFRDLQTGRVESWSFDSSDGHTIDGRVYFPPNFDVQKIWPVIVYYYGGTSPTSRSWGGRYPKEYWTSNGYVVYVVQPSGATGYGQTFSAEHVNNWGLTSADQIIEGTKKFLEAHSWADPKGVGCIGASYGGFMTMLLTTKTDIFSAAVAHAGISSLSSYWGEGYWGYLYSSGATAGSFPWNRRDLYVDQSPLFRADQVRVPLLMTHGGADTNVPVGESEQFYIALKLLGKEVEYLRIAGENHWILEHDKRVLWSQSILAWFDRKLKSQPGWWDSLYPPMEE
jgi:dipeptidyl aminopeptidase/acylaminoacyl peptidase